MTIKQARAQYKQLFNAECPENLTVEQIQEQLAQARAKKAYDAAVSEYQKVFGEAPAEGLTKEQIIDQVKAKKLELKSEQKPAFKVNFGVEIRGMGKFTKEDLEANPDACEYLHGIGSPAVTKL